ncbi:MAG: YfhO family protein [Bacteroidales bacterium]|nr:YfhO family protein [Bacteroidales bacterium]
MLKALKTFLFHFIAIIVMMLASMIYFSPVLHGKVVVQGDIQKAEAMSHMQKEVDKQTGEIPNWNPAMFSGMPGYQTAVEPQKSIFTPIKSLLIMRPLGWERNIGMLWLYLIGFYVAMVAILDGRSRKHRFLNLWLALASALAFGLGSYNIIICEAGHITKGWAIAMIAPILGGLVLSFRSVDKESNKKLKINWKRLVWGFILFTLATGLQITFNHIQITYYTAIGGVILALSYLVYAIKDRWLTPYAVILGVMLIGSIFALGGNYRHLAVNQEYAKATMRGGSEITVKPESAAKSEGTLTGGLDIDYAFRWSYGVDETYTLLVPGAKGGGSQERLPEDSKLARMMGSYAPLYWGNQDFTSGPVYFGAIIIFLFLLGCIIVDGPERWWLIIATLVAIVLSWGRNFMPLNEFLFNTLPMYNKFRTPSMSLVLANATMVIMAILALKALFEKMPYGKEKSVVEAVKANAQAGAAKKPNGNKSQKQEDIQKAKKQMRLALAISGGIVVFILLIGIFGAKKWSYTPADNDEGLKAQYVNILKQQGLNNNQIAQWEMQEWPSLQNNLKEERQDLFKRDSKRSLIFVVLCIGLLFLFEEGLFKNRYIITAALGLLMTIDLWGVDNRYLNKNNKDTFVDANKLALRENDQEKMLDRVAAANGDQNYRVYDLTVNTFNDSRPSAFHNQIGGYSAAKLRRYQDLIDFYLGYEQLFGYVNSASIGILDESSMATDTPRLGVSEPHAVLDMLNCRYLMLNLQGALPVRRATALGNCWLVDDVKMVDDANAEILALNDFDPAKTAIVDKSKWAKLLEGVTLAPIDETEHIELISNGPYNPDHLTYKSNTHGEHVAVFSEVYYAPDWRAYIDGKPVEHFRVNYILRALVLPAGEHTIEFVNEAPTLHKTDNATLLISIVMVLLMASALVLVYLFPLIRGKKTKTDK